MMKSEEYPRSLVNYLGNVVGVEGGIYFFWMAVPGDGIVLAEGTVYKCDKCPNLTAVNSHRIMPDHPSVKSAMREANKFGLLGELQGTDETCETCVCEECLKKKESPT